MRLAALSLLALAACGRTLVYFPDSGPPPTYCFLTLAPATLDFGVVAVGTPLSKAATLQNVGQADCHVTGVVLDPTSDPSYALDPSQSTSVVIPPGGSASLTVDVNLNNTNPPNARTGSVHFTSDDPLHPQRKLLLVAYLVDNNPYGQGWPKWHHDNNNSGKTSADTSHYSGVETCTFPGFANVQSMQFSGTTYINSPVVADNLDGTSTVYQLSLDAPSAVDFGGGTLWAVHYDGTSCSPVWNVQTSDPTGDAHPSTPVVTKSGNIYVVSGCDAPSGQVSNLFYISPAGSILWQTVYGEDGFDACPDLSSDGILYEASDDGSVSDQPTSNGDLSAVTFQALDGGAVDGGAAVEAGPGLALPLTNESERFGIAVADDDSSFWGNNGQFFAMTAPSAGFTLAPSWPDGGVTLVNSQFNSAISDLAVDPVNTRLVFAYSAWLTTTGFLSGVEGVLEALSMDTGQVAWVFPLNPAPLGANQGLTSDFGNAAPAVDVDLEQVYVGHADGLYALDESTGTLVWHYHSANVSSSPAIGGDGTIFFGTEDGCLHAVSSAGQLVNKTCYGAAISSSPAIGDDGTVFFMTDNGVLHGLR